MAEKKPEQKAQKAQDVPRNMLRKPMPAVVSQQPKPVSASAPITSPKITLPKPVSAPAQIRPTEQTKIVPKASSLLVFRRAAVAAP
jgi:hypothetical protein